MAEASQLRELPQTSGPATASLDAAVEYIRAAGLRLLPLYVMAMVPFSIVVLMLVDAISAQHRSVVGWMCAALVPATLWRWGWLARMQQRVQQDIQARPGLRLGNRLFWILLFRLYNSVVITWGGFMVLPSFYGLFTGSFAAPFLLEREGPLMGQTFRLLGFVHRSAGRLTRVLLGFSVISLALVAASFVVQYVVVHMVLPSFLGIDSTSIALTLSSWAWTLSLLYFVLLLLDFVWTILGVFLYYDSQSRLTGSDLRARLGFLAGGTS